MSECRHRNLIAVKHWSSGRFQVWIKPIAFFETVKALHINSAKITIIRMVFWFSPNHRYAKFHIFVLSVGPHSQNLYAGFTDNMRSPGFILISEFDAEVCIICSLDEISDGLSLFFNSVITTYVAKDIRIITTLPLFELMLLLHSNSTS